MGSHSQRLNMDQGLLLTTLLQACTGQPFLLDLFHPRQSSDRADTSQYHAPEDSYGVPQVDEYHAPSTGDSYGVPKVNTGYQHTNPEDSYGVPHASPCPTYTTTTIPPPSYHQKDKPKAPFPDVLVFLKASIIFLNPPQSHRMTMVFLVLFRNLATHR